MIRIRKQGLLVLACALLGGCVSMRQYPEHWPKRLAQTGTCVPVSGHYQAVSVPQPPLEQTCEAGGGMSWMADHFSRVSLPGLFGFNGQVPVGSWGEIEQDSERLVFRYVQTRALLEQNLSHRSSGNWQLRLLPDGEGVAELHLRRGTDYECSAEGIRLYREEPPSSANVGVVFSAKTLLLTRATDGSLILEARESGVGAILLPPFAVAAHGNRWARWLPRPEQIPEKIMAPTD